MTKLLRDDNAEVRDMAISTLGRLDKIAVTDANALIPILLEALVKAGTWGLCTATGIVLIIIGLYLIGIHLL